MKKVYLLIILLATIFAACSADDDNDEGTSWEINMTSNIESNGTEFICIFRGEGGITSINWGDKEDNETLKLKSDENLPVVRHLDVGTYTITIKGHGSLTSLECCYENHLTTLDVNKCPTLEILSCSHNKLTSLNVSSHPNLTRLTCVDNGLHINS